jgi:hypothetical protein
VAERGELAVGPGFCMTAGSAREPSSRWCAPQSFPGVKGAGFLALRRVAGCADRRASSAGEARSRMAAARFGFWGGDRRHQLSGQQRVVDPVLAAGVSGAVMTKPSRAPEPEPAQHRRGAGVVGVHERLDARHPWLAEARRDQQGHRARGNAATASGLGEQIAEPAQRGIVGSGRRVSHDPRTAVDAASVIARAGDRPARGLRRLRARGQAQPLRRSWPERESGGRSVGPVPRKP